MTPPVGPRRTDPESPIPLIPVRMVNEWVYCPRLAYLEWVDGEWADSADTEDGRRTHARVDKSSGRLPPLHDTADQVGPPFRTRSVTMSSERLGIIAKMDLIEGSGRRVVPVDFKRGKRPHTAAAGHDPERVQVCAQALILEDAGYEVREGVLWFSGSRERVRVELDDAIRTRTLEAISGLRDAVRRRKRPPPLEDSPKCPRCSLAGICLPDEVNFFKQEKPPRPLNPADDAALPLHVQTPGALVRKKGERLQIVVEKEVKAVRLSDVSEVSLYGPVSITAPTIGALLRRETPVSWYSTGGWFLGHAVSPGRRALDTRRAQFRLADNAAASSQIAAGLVAAKIRNQRTMLRRNWKGGDDATRSRDRILARLRVLAIRSEREKEPERLLGREGEAASLYFGAFEKLVSADRNLHGEFAWTARSRRPPTDPVNALLSFSYSLAVRTFTVALETAGLDPLLGFFHRPRPGRPALALDMMEPFRPILCDSTVIMAINNGEVREMDFVRNGPACAMKPSGRRALIAAWERRLDQEAVHPVFGYRISMRRIIVVQCRLLARHLLGEIPRVPHYTPR
ncbi:MAG: CRISPR-associated endonuclease Cas1 [Acidobacteria bacterium]|nr:CRISPR-associated endonuclease Cas1 [Acidobacteriota bacterium]MYH22216.1 CRISPR-associated endonuclease Cas1 [Acidobacteriota bacterium]